MRRKQTLRRSLHGLALAVGLGFALVLALPVAAAPAARQATQAASISGTVVNGTHENAPIANQQVTLQATEVSPSSQTGAPTTRDLVSVTTDAQGHFSFTDVPAGTADQFAVYTHFQGGLYSSPRILVDAGSQQTITLSVYDATTDSSALSIANVTMLVRPPDVPHGLIGIGEFVTFHNGGNTAFVGNANAANASSMPPLLRFAVPTGSSNLVPGAGFVGAQILTIGSGFGATATVPPGTSVFAFAYDLPYTGTTATYTYQAVYPTAQAVVLLPPSMHADGGNFAPQGNITAFDGTYQVFQAGAAAPNASESLRLTNLPRAGETSDLDQALLLEIGAFLALLAALALAAAAWRGDLSFIQTLSRAWLTRGDAASRDESSEAADVTAAADVADTARATKGTPTTERLLGARADEREGVLRAIAELETPQARRTLPPREREQRIAALRAQARALLAEELGASTAPQPRTPSSPTESAPDRAATPSLAPMASHASGEEGAQ